MGIFRPAEDYGLLGDIYIGTPCVRHSYEQRSQLETSNSSELFTLYFSTLSADFWVARWNCTGGCNTSTAFNDSASSTFKVVRDSTGEPILASAYIGDHSLDGSFVQDTVVLENDLVLLDQSWILVDQADEDFPGLFGSAAGMVGLGLDTTDLSGATPFLRSLFGSSQVVATELGLQLSPNYEGSQDGFLILGGRDQSAYTGDVEFHPLITRGDPQWRLNISGT